MAKATGLKAAIQAKNEAQVKATVDTAVQTYKDALKDAIDNGKGVVVPKTPSEAQVNTVFGDVPFTMVFDEDTKWQVITQAYVEVIQEVGYIAKDVTKEVRAFETAKIIANNAVLRSVGGTSTTDETGLL